MPPQTHYNTLGLAPSAPLPVIRAAYKALALEYHPDKTTHLPPTERMERGAKFREIQEAHDVLTNPTMRAIYDTEIELQSRATSDPPSRKNSKSWSSKGETKLTTPAEKKAMKAKAENLMNVIREERMKRDKEDANMSLDQLRHTLRIWQAVVERHKDVPVEYAHCMIKIHEYEQKVRVKELQMGFEKEEWLNSMASPKSPLSKPSQKAAGYASAKPGRRSSAKQTPEYFSTPKTSDPEYLSRSSQKMAEKKQAERKRATEDAARAEARAKEKVHQETLKQAQYNMKAEAVRAEKEKQKRKADEAAKAHADRIAKARAKAAPMLPKFRPRETEGENAARGEMVAGVKGRSRHCERCGQRHASLPEWKKCNMQALQDEVDDQSFFHVV
ncbi:DnaJ-domain-containing protein [Zopfia rhizophila CBS 207.26]|uniref:DnaJ-domain-containing protein n=1 Tax=Zopfia rhizophila CBS 207.26 TaxID=1314779 RepID=A0A6A6E1R0_9PEZI|nr:DnaJ-domain-containing protein [Zopfia rhizophila CBS 207.26]